MPARRVRIPFVLLALACAGALAAPHLAFAHAIPWFGPIIEESWNQCALSWGAVIDVINNVITVLLSVAIVGVAPLAIAYAGFLLVASPAGAGSVSQARGILLNTVIGIAVAFAAWIIIDAVMAVFYHPDGGALKAWSSLITSGGVAPCIDFPGSLSSAPNGGSVTGTDANGTQYVSFDPNAVSSGACSSSFLSSLEPSLSTAQANTFACLAKYESTCGTNLENGSWDKANSAGLASSAYGAFQVLLSSNHAAFENQACYKAVGASGPLNCQNGFDSKGFPLNNATEQQCVQAASDLGCSLAAATYLEQQSGWSPWTADPKSTSQAACIKQFSGG